MNTARFKLAVAALSAIALSHCSSTSQSGNATTSGYRTLEEKPIMMNGKKYIQRRVVVTEKPLETMTEMVEVK